MGTPTVLHGPTTIAIPLVKLAIECQAVHDAAITRQKALKEQACQHRERILRLGARVSVCIDGDRAWV